MKCRSKYFTPSQVKAFLNIYVFYTIFLPQVQYWRFECKKYLEHFIREFIFFFTYFEFPWSHELHRFRREYTLCSRSAGNYFCVRPKACLAIRPSIVPIQTLLIPQTTSIQHVCIRTQRLNNIIFCLIQ